MTDGKGGFGSHADSQDHRMNPLPSSGNPDDLADHLGKIQLSNPIGKPISNPEPVSAGHDHHGAR